LDTTARGVSIQISRAAPSAMRAAKVPNVAPWLTAQAVLASAFPSSSITCTYVG
jgi:hypothetical protein